MSPEIDPPAAVSAAATDGRPDIRTLLINVALLALAVGVPVELLRRYVRYLWIPFASVIAVGALIWVFAKFLLEPSIKTAVEAWLKAPAARRKCVTLLLTTSLSAAYVVMVLPREYDPIIVILPYGGPLADTLKKDNLVIRIGDSETIVRDPKARAVYVGWPHSRVDASLGEDDKAQQTAETSAFATEAQRGNNWIARKIEEGTPSSKIDVQVKGWVASSAERITVFLPDVRPEQNIEISLISRDGKRGPLQFMTEDPRLVTRMKIGSILHQYFLIHPVEK